MEVVNVYFRQGYEHYFCMILLPWGKCLKVQGFLKSGIPPLNRLTFAKNWCSIIPSTSVKVYMSRLGSSQSCKGLPIKSEMILVRWRLIECSFCELP